MVKILQKNEKVLREVAAPVALDEIGTKRLTSIIEDMQEGLLSQEDAVAIAAPQIGVSLRIFVVSKRIFAMENDDTENTEKYDDKVFINPEITKLSKEKSSMEEGCLSVRYLYGKVKRSKKASIRALDELGKPFTMGASGILAQIFQHEVDHLDGILFIDKAVNLEEIPPERIPLRS
jgi:peptide deformylase